MTPLGKCLTFYLKYPAEMKRLYEVPYSTGEEPDVEGLQDAKQVLEKIRVVGDTACIEAASFLNACTSLVEPHLNGIGKCKQTRRNLQNTWAAMFQLSARESNAVIWVGYFINERQSSVVPWYWTSQRQKQHAASILGIPSNLDAEMGIDPKHLVLAKIPIVIPSDLNNLDVDAEPLIEQVRRSFGPFTPDTLAALAKLSSRE